MLANITLLPESIVRAMLHRFVPEGDITLEIFRVGVGEGTHLQEELVTIGCSVFEFVCEILGWIRTRPAERGHEVEDVRQEQSAIVMPIVADEPIGHGRLR